MRIMRRKVVQEAAGMSVAAARRAAKAYAKQSAACAYVVKQQYKVQSMPAALPVSAAAASAIIMPARLSSSKYMCQ